MKIQAVCTLLASLLLACRPAPPEEGTKKPASPPKHLIVQEAAALPVAGGKIEARIYLDQESIGAREAALSTLSIASETKIPSHVHPTAAEILWIIEGEGELQLPSGIKKVSAGDAVLIPAGATHGFVAGGAAVKAVQFYAPGGPEQRFRGTSQEGTVTPEESPTPDPGGVVVSPWAEISPVVNEDGETSRVLLKGVPVPGGSVSLLHFEYPPRYPSHPHPHDDVSEWIYIVRGAGVAEIDGAEYPVRAGGAYYTPKGSVMGLRTEEETHILVLVFSPTK